MYYIYKKIKNMSKQILQDQDNKYGFFDENNQIIIPSEYDLINYLDDHSQFLFVQKDGKAGIFSEDGQNLIPVEFDAFSVIPNSELIFCEIIENIDSFDDYGNPSVEQAIKFALYHLPQKRLFANEYFGGFSNYTDEGMILVSKAGATPSYGVLNLKGEQIIPFEYDTIEFFRDSDPNETEFFFKVGEKDENYNTKYGLLDSKLNLLFKIEYDDIFFHKKNFIVIKQEGKKRIFNHKGEQILDTVFSKLDFLKHDFFEFATEESEEQIGLLNIDLTICLPAIYYGFYVNNFPSESPLINVCESKEVGLYDLHKKQMVVPCEYTDICASNLDLIQVCKNRFYGMLNHNFDLIIPCIYESLWFLSNENGFLEDRLVCKNSKGKYGIINLKNQVIVPCEHDSILDLEENQKNVKVINYIYLDLDGKKIDISVRKDLDLESIKQKYEANGIEKIGNYFRLTDQNYNYFLLNKEQEIVISEASELLYDGKEWCCYRKIHDNNLVIHKNLKTGKEISFEGSLHLFTDGLVLKYSYQDLSYEYINEDGEKAFEMPFAVDNAESFSDGVARLFQSAKEDQEFGTYHFIDKKGNILISKSCYSLDYARKDAYIIYQNYAYGLIDQHGQELLPAIYTEIKALNEHKILLREDTSDLINIVHYIFDLDSKQIKKLPYIIRYYESKPIYGLLGAWKYQEDLLPDTLEPKYGFVNLDGEISIPFEYDEVGEFKEGRAWVKKGEKYAFIDLKGNIIIPFELPSVYAGQIENYSDGLVKIGVVSEVPIF